MVRYGCVLVVLAMSLSACGTSPGDRAATGAGIGAAGGAIVGAVTGLTVVEGALIGAGVGGVTGALTDPGKINLGKPIWQSDAASSGASSHASRPQLVMRIQQGLTDLGYSPGPVDGVLGPETTGAIRRYQGDRGLLTDGRPSPELAERIQQDLSG